MLNIGFVVPYSSANSDPFRNQPLVAIYLLSILEAHFGDKVKLSVVDLRGINEAAALYHIPENDVFLYSVASPDANDVYGIVKKIRLAYPKAKHIAGGPHISLFPEDNSKIFDAVVVGEGEESIKKAISDIFNSTLKPLYKQDGPIDINSYPYPSRKFLPRTAVVERGLLSGENLELLGTTVNFSRGCPYNCYFCANHKLKFGPVRYRSPKLVWEEIEYLKREYKIKVLAFKDDMCIPTDVKVAQPFLEAIGKTDIKWRGQSRVDSHPDMVKLAKDVGCVELGLGIESVCPDVLKLINKKLDIEKVKSFIKLLNKTGIRTRVHLILGLPGEPDDIVEKTVDFIDEVNPATVLLNILCPMPGSQIYHCPEQFGIKLKELDWGAYHSVFGRFDAAEKPKMVFEYDEITPWGKGRGTKNIIDNYSRLQAILRERKLNF